MRTLSLNTCAALGVIAVASLSSGCLPPDTPPVARPDGLSSLHVDVSEDLDLHEESQRPRKLGLAIFGVLAAASSRVLDSGLGSVGYDLPEGDEETPSIALTVAGNTRGELNLCDCDDGRRGGLARRAAILATMPQESLHIDTGDSLSEVIAAPDGLDDLAARRAEAMVEAFGVMGVDVMLVNLRDLRLPVDHLIAAGQRAGVTLLSSNLLLDEGDPAFESGVLYERGGHKLGLIGLTAHHNTNPRFLDHSGLRFGSSEEIVKKESARLRKRGAVGIILLSGLGVSESETLLHALDDEDLPDMVLLSGTARLTKAPSWVRGVPMLEPGDRGRQLLIVTLYERDNGLSFDEPEGESQANLNELVKSTRRAGLQGRAYLTDNNGQKRTAAERREKELVNLVETIHTLTEKVLIEPPSPGAPAGFDVEWLDLEEAVSPSPDVQAIVDPVETELP